MHRYELVLSNDKAKLYGRFAIFIFILNVIAVSYFLYSSYEKIPKSTTGLLSLALLILTVVSCVFTYYKKKKELAFLLSTIGFVLCWILIGYWWTSVIVVVLFYLYSKSNKEMTVSFTDHIIYPSFPKQTFEWIELNNVILKDGLLTIDFKSNKIIQQLIKYSLDVNEKEFNEFCKQQLNRSIAKLD